MTPSIDAIFLDVGNTLRIVVEDPVFQAEAKNQLMTLIGAKEPPYEFFEKIEERWKRYRKQSKESLLEATEFELWTRWLLPDYPLTMIGPLAGRLTRLWRDRDGRRIPRTGVKETIVELYNRGYLLGIIANTITETEIPAWMYSDGVIQYIHTTILSSRVGYRKPDPAIYLLAARKIGVEPSRCAYLGDNPVRDVEGTQAAGFGMMILIDEPATRAKEPPTGEHHPDYTITAMNELLDIFPPCKPVK